jgi:hypothetical protein
MFKLYSAFDKSEECVILTDTNVVTGMNACASLSYDDVAGKHVLTVSALYAKALSFAITAVLCGTDTFFVSKKLQA